MAQIFHRSTNTIAKVSIFGGVIFVALFFWVYASLLNAGYGTNQGIFREQPVPFSHQHHVGGLGIDCRYCHTSVEKSATAGIPPTKTCMGCHSQIWSDSPTLEPVRSSFRNDTSIEWTKVHDLPDFAYFDHSAHVNRGVGCTTCHGRVDRMPLMAQAASLQMEWCLRCHRHPERYVRPQVAVFDAAYEPPADQLALGTRLVKEYGIQTRTSCSTCHR